MTKEQAELEIDVRNAEEAQRLLNHPFFLKAFADLEEACIKEWKGAGNPEDRERCWLAFQMLQKVRAQIATHIDTGRIAEAELTRLQKLRKKIGL